MEEYLKRYKRNKLKRFFIALTIMSLLFIVFLLIYNMYNNINIYENIQTKSDINMEKTIYTVEDVKKRNKTITEMIEEVNSTVVGISKLKNAGSTVFLENGTSKMGLGTGVIVSENGYILTNEHVSGSKYSNCYVTLNTGNTYNGNVVWSESNLDLAIVKINVKNLNYAKLGNSDKINAGEAVYAIGNPIGFEFQRTVTAGIISAINRTVRIEEKDRVSYMDDLIQTDATINLGNSGGPLINIDGEVIGINTVKITSAEGIGFAVPINPVKEVVNQYIKNGKFEEASIGIFAYDKNVIPYIDLSKKIAKGIYVAQVIKNSPAYKSGLREEDIILKIDNKELEKMCDLRCYIYTKKPGEQVELTILRDNIEMKVNVKLTKK